MPINIVDSNMSRFIIVQLVHKMSQPTSVPQMPPAYSAGSVDLRLHGGQLCSCNSTALHHRSIIANTNDLSRRAVFLFGNKIPSFVS